MPDAILVVNPDPDAQCIFCTALEHSGYEVRVAPDASRAVDAAVGCALVITDYPVRLADGRTVTELLRAHEATAALPILNATTHALPHQIQEAFAAGVTETVVLPAHLDAIVGVVRRLLSSSASRRVDAGAAGSTLVTPVVRHADSGS